MTLTAERYNNFGCVGNTIRLRSGRYFDLANPRAEDVDITDIAGALSKTCRFGGQVESFFSVAEHCVNCARQCDLDGRTIAVSFAALLHDATEAYVGDMVRPLKIMIPLFKEVELRIEKAIGERFNVDFDEHHAIIKEVDNAMVIAERKQLFTRDSVKWNGEDECRVLYPKINCYGPEEAERRYLELFEEYL